MEEGSKEELEEWSEEGSIQMRERKMSEGSEDGEFEKGKGGVGRLKRSKVNSWNIFGGIKLP